MTGRTVSEVDKKQWDARKARDFEETDKAWGWLAGEECLASDPDERPCLKSENGTRNDGAEMPVKMISEKPRALQKCPEKCIKPEMNSRSE